MTNKPMLSVERELLERAASAIEKHHGSLQWVIASDLRAIIDKPAECRCKRYGKDNPHWPCPVHAKPAVQHQGEPVAWMFRWDYDHGNGWCRNAVRFVESMEHVEHEDKSTWRDITPLYAEQPAPVAAVIPDKINPESLYPDQADCGWNDCIDEMRRLNGVKP